MRTWKSQVIVAKVIEWEKNLELEMLTVKLSFKNKGTAESPCLNQTSFIGSLFSQIRCKARYERLWLYWPMQQKGRNVCGICCHHFPDDPASLLTIYNSLRGHQSDHLLGMPVWVLISPKLWEQVWHPSLISSLFWEVWKLSTVYAHESHSFSNSVLNFWTSLFVAVIHKGTPQCNRMD